MTSGGINLDHVLPEEYDLPNPVSNSSSVLRKTQVRFLPNAQVDYGPNGNNIIEFTISSPTEQLLLPESYFVMEVYRSDENDALDYNAMVDKAGIHSFFKSIQVRAAGANVQISEAREYNRFTNLTLPYNSTPFTVECKMGVEAMGRYENMMEERLPPQTYPTSGVFAADTLGLGSSASEEDDVAYFFKLASPQAGNIKVRSPNSVVALTLADIVITHEVPGKVLIMSAGVAVDTAITADDYSELTLAEFEDKFARDTQITMSTGQTVLAKERIAAGLYKVRPLTTTAALNQRPVSYTLLNNRRRSNRSRILEKHSVANRQYWLFKPNMAFFNYNFPLYTVKGGITFRLELERPELVFKTGLNPVDSAAQNMDYTISRPRFVGMMSAPEPSVMRDTVSKWNSAEGIIYYMPSYLYRESQTDMETANVALNFHAGVRSARSILMAVQLDNVSQSISDATAKACDSLSQALRTNISTWQVQIGAHLFPMERLDITKTLPNSRYFHEALHRMGYMTQNSSAWIPFSEFHDESFMYSSPLDTYKTLKEAKQFLIWVDLSRSNTANSALCGTDLSLVPLQFNLERTAPVSKSEAANDGKYGGSNFIYRAFIFYDSFLRMSSNMITTLQ